MVVYLAFAVSLKNNDFKLDDELRVAKFFTKAEVLELEFDSDEALVKEHINTIWP